MRQLYVLPWVLVLTVVAGRLGAQDAQFSQFFTTPTLLNPALTGLFNGRYRVALNHRSQWGQALESPFSTSAFAADFHYDLQPKRRNSDAFGGGVYFLNDRVAEVGFTNNQAMFAAAFHKSLDARGLHTLSLGVQAGIVQRNVGYGDLTFPDEFDGLSAFVPNSTGELLPENSIAFGDYQLGLNYSYSPTYRGTGYTAGISVHHLSSPEQSFYADLAASSPVEVTNRLYRRYGAYVSVRLPVGRTAELLPRVYYLHQGPHEVTQAGLTLRLPTRADGASAMHLGGWARAVQNTQGYRPESLTALVGLEVDGFLFGFSYDTSIHPLAVSPRHRGAFEISASYTGRTDDDEAVPCPRF